MYNKKTKKTEFSRDESRIDFNQQGKWLIERLDGKEAGRHNLDFVDERLEIEYIEE
jgi:hypothetical protein